MESVTLSRIDAEQHYAEMRPAIDLTVKYFCHRHRCPDIEERQSEANTIFVRAIQRIPRYAADRLSGHIQRVIYRKLHSRWIVANGLQKKNHPTTVPLQPEVEQPARREFDTTEFLRGLSLDAQICAGIVLDPAFDCTEGGTRILRGRVREQLKSRGWNNSRINRAFQQVENSL